MIGTPEWKKITRRKETIAKLIRKGAEGKIKRHRTFDVVWVKTVAQSMLDGTFSQ